MKPAVAIFCHSLVSDWNHGNAHFLRGIVSELQFRGHQVRVFEPHDAWSRLNLEMDHGGAPAEEFALRFPDLRSTRYAIDDLQHLDRWLDGVDLILVHEWNDVRLVAKVGDYRRRNESVRLFFHDTHHRAITAPEEMARYDLSHFDGVLAYGQSLKYAYERTGWGKQVHVWHEAADVRVFHPPYKAEQKAGDLVWIGNWGDDERSQELREFFIEPVAQLGLRATAFGVRYPDSALHELGGAGIRYGGWLPNYRAPEIFAHHHVTVHVPRRPYTQQLPGIPTIRPFEALACGIPLVSAPWDDIENLFRPGRDFLTARNGHEMKAHLRSVLHEPTLAASLTRSGFETIRARHTCAHRLDELLRIYAQSKAVVEQPSVAPAEVVA